MDLLIGLFLGMILLGRVLSDRADTNQALKKIEDRSAQLEKWKNERTDQEVQEALRERLKHKENYPQIVAEIHTALKGVPCWDGWEPRLFRSQFPATCKSSDVEYAINKDTDRALDVLMGAHGYITTHGLCFDYPDLPGTYELVTWIQRKLTEAGRPAKLMIYKLPSGAKWYGWVRGEYNYLGQLDKAIAFIPPRIPGKAVHLTPPQTNTRGDQA